ncbi:hypothetical protein H6G76_33455 [Nostoc sp. FACHB-152]|uniref:hypothetical protein n=1 Tax=unclassified Nostoc TaxID=2593658 RepID=UPI001688BF74|nr:MULTISPECIES: hypothetical protein [unclassified Nostoc]MBD2451944.1 hypothetical protein [Nostoc sp. FACHB-152]MBD2473036.1 hypothetical protein [Nostoc sp. FACHB-145]
MKSIIKSILLTSLLTVGMTEVALLSIKPVAAQEQINYELQAPTGIPIRAMSITNTPLYLNSDRSYNYHLQVSRGTYFGDTYIPAGAIIQGKFQPANGGLRYVAYSVSFGGYIYNINAASDVIEGQQKSNHKDGKILSDAGIGAAGATALEGIFGHHRLSLGGILGGAAAGAVVGAVTVPSSHEIVVIPSAMLITLYSR